MKNKDGGEREGGLLTFSSEKEGSGAYLRGGRNRGFTVT